MSATPLRTPPTAAQAPTRDDVVTISADASLTQPVKGYIRPAGYVWQGVTEPRGGADRTAVFLLEHPEDLNVSDAPYACSFIAFNKERASQISGVFHGTITRESYATLSWEDLSGPHFYTFKSDTKGTNISLELYDAPDPWYGDITVATVNGTFTPDKISYPMKTDPLAGCGGSCLWHVFGMYDWPISS